MRGAPWPLDSRGMGETENSPSNVESAQGAKPSPAASAQPVSAIDDLIQEAVESRGRYRNSYDPPTDPHAESELTASAIPVDQSPSGADPDTSSSSLQLRPTISSFVRNVLGGEGGKGRGQTQIILFVERIGLKFAVLRPIR